MENFDYDLYLVTKINIQQGPPEVIVELLLKLSLQQQWAIMREFTILTKKL